MLLHRPALPERRAGLRIRHLFLFFLFRLLCLKRHAAASHDAPEEHRDGGLQVESEIIEDFPGLSFELSVNADAYSFI